MMFPFYVDLGMTLAWALAFAAWILARFQINRLRAELRGVRAELHSERMAAEARARGVGGVGEHGAPVIVPLEPVSRTWDGFRDPRFDIPTDPAKGMGSFLPWPRRRAKE